MVPAKLKPLTSPDRSASTLASAVDFLTMVWDSHDPAAYTFLGTRQGASWNDHAIRGNRGARIARLLESYAPERFDIYFCPNAFTEPRRQMGLALPSPYAWCDIDDADPRGYDPAPNILWRTSPGRLQGIWIWDQAQPGAVAEIHSRNIVYKDGGDKGGWSITKMLRLPGTINHKPEYGRPLVTLRRFDVTPQRLPASIRNERPQIAKARPTKIITAGLDAKEIMRRYRLKIGLQAGTLMMAKRVMRKDRSGAVFIIVAALIAAGASDSEIATVLLVNPYFVDKWGADPDEAEKQIIQIHARLEAGQ
ncbi:DNA-primase RepB domain-containing protein [Novosphingobium sp. Fuku2-ISO-50]|uniref:DNA-primase RepB domain-containing protein n=1 Tax=Novosphingobium sp. Fuku2-ISO-50 TaxID=1739114 RepID=UPI000A676CC4|nr:DNA-primase RepB domain-containing protein [Novosphingobium sp. Fuku2-ISO-50]